MGYIQDKIWEESCHAQVISILNRYMHYLAVVSIATDEQDRKHATDFEVKVKGATIAVRLRRPCTYRDLTLRVQRDNGTKTEVEKIKEGYADRYFYGWTNDKGIILEWMLIDLDRLRASGLLEEKRRPIPNRDYNGNPDGTHFIVITLKELRTVECIIVSEGIQEQRNVNFHPSMNDLEEGMKRASVAGYNAGNYASQIVAPIHLSDEDIAILDYIQYCQSHQQWQEEA